LLGGSLNSVIFELVPFPALRVAVARRCSHLNGRFEDYWDGRREARAA
jgi:hypothetical protein